MTGRLAPTSTAGRAARRAGPERPSCRRARWPAGGVARADLGRGSAALSRLALLAIALTAVGLGLCEHVVGRAHADGPSPVELGRFAPPLDPDRPPPGWELLTFPRITRHTRYTVVFDGDRHVLRAESHGAASGLYRPVDLDPRVHQVLTWRWKVQRVLASADARTRRGDDCAARVYVAFRHDPARATLWERARYGVLRLVYGRYPPRVALTYVWGNRLPAGAVLDNAYTDRVKMIVAQSGPPLAGRWVEERRNVYEDYRRVVGGEPPRIEGVAVMTDTDDTGESAVAWYDAVAFHTGP